MKFLSNVLATLVGLFLFFIIMFFGFFLIGVLIGGSPDDGKKTSVKNNSVIVLDLENVSQDYSAKTIVTDFPLFNTENYNGLVDILNAIDNAKTDNKIEGISILNTDSMLGFAQIKALRDKLEDFKKSGKFVVSYFNNYTQEQYYLGSVADTVYINPVGGLDFKGLSSEILFFKDFQEKSGITMEVIRHGKYKSAVEPFLENQMSDENRLQMLELLNSAWETLVTDISKSRNIPVDSLNVIADRLGARTPQLAKTSNLIDKVVYEDEYQNGIKTALGLKTNEEYNAIDMSKYAANVAISNKNKKAEDRIAVIYAQGQIFDGEGDAKNIGEGYVKQALQDAVKDDKVKAIVLRVDSPGGSALASDIIWREIELTKKHKPVVVSMGNLAASGGYYISCNADRIFAEPTTITGSIGVFGAIPNFRGLANKWGIYSDQVSTHKNSSNYSFFQPMNENFKEVLTESIENIYDVFLTRVADGRGMTKEQVNEVAQGRVWTGTDAKRLGLVDEIGGLEDAIKYASELVGTDDYKLRSFPVFKRTFEEYVSENSPFPLIKSKETLIKEEIGEENYLIIQQIKNMNSRKGIQAMMPYQIIIR
ncbi:MAG: signal peptide peptidase SppA [Flavobacteriaceae bacterium]